MLPIGMPDGVRADYLAGPWTGGGESIPAGFLHHDRGGPCGVGFAAGGHGLRVGILAAVLAVVLVAVAGVALRSPLARVPENALKLAFKMTGRTKAVALEQGWHGRTAAAGAVTWGALEKWYGFPRRPFDVEFTPRDDPAALERHIEQIRRLQ